MRPSRPIASIVATVLAAMTLLVSNASASTAPSSLPDPANDLAGSAGVGGAEGDPTVFWQGFPGRAAQRPIVVLDRLAQFDGFAGTDREALARALVHVAIALPSAPAELPLTTASGVRMVDAISAGQALHAWQLASGAAMAEAAPVPSIQVIAVDLGQMSLATDRGRLAIPAWLFHTEHGATIRWPALSPRVFWRGGGALASSAIPAASVDASGTRLTVTLSVGGGGGSALCHGSGARWFTARADLSGALIFVTPQTHDAGPPPALPVGAGCIHLLYAVPHQTILKLAEPLGERVLVGPDGGAVTVTRA